MADDRAETLDAAFRRALGLDGAVDPARAGARRRDAASMLARAAERALEDGRSELAVLMCLAARRAGETVAGPLEETLAAAFATTCCMRVVPDAHLGGVSALARSPDGEMLASGGADGRIRLWSGGDAEPTAILQGHEDRVRRVEFNDVWPLLSSCGDDGAAIVWDVAERRELWRAQGLDASALAARFSPCGRRVAVAGGPEWSGLRDARSGELLFAFARHDGIVVYDAAFSPDGRRLATCGDDGRAVVWDVETGGLLAELVCRRPVRSVVFDCTGGRLAAACYDGSATVLSLEDGSRRVFEVEGRRAQSVVFVGEERLWVLYDGGSELLLGLAGASLAATNAPQTPHASAVHAVCAHDDDRLVAADQDGLVSVRLLSGGEPKTLALLRSAGAAVHAVDLSADGTHVAAGDADGALRLWSLDQAEAERRSLLRGEDLWRAATAWRKASGRAPTQREIELIASEVEAWVLPERG
jgi:WD40 repeat protein